MKLSTYHIERENGALLFDKPPNEPVYVSSNDWSLSQIMRPKTVTGSMFMLQSSSLDHLIFKLMLGLYKFSDMGYVISKMFSGGTGFEYVTLSYRPAIVTPEESTIVVSLLLSKDPLQPARHSIYTVTNNKILASDDSVYDLEFPKPPISDWINIHHVLNS